MSMSRKIWVRLGAAALGLAFFVILLLLSAARLAGEQAAAVQPSATPTPITSLYPVPITAPHFESLSYGIQAFLWWNESSRTWDLEMIRMMNFTHVKQIFGWEDIEPERGRYDWSRADDVVDEVAYRGLSLVARLDHPPTWALVDPALRADGVPFDVEAYGAFCGAVAERYRGRIAGYQVWNEPNLQREWNGYPPDAAGYVALLRACYTAIKAADPDSIVISAGLAPTGTDLPIAVPDERYLQEMFDAGLSEVYDVLGLHAPGYHNPPSISPEAVAAANDGHRWMAFRHVEDMRRLMIANGDAERQVALLEFGWTTDPLHPEYAWHAVDEATQAEYLVGAYAYAAEYWRPWVGLMSTIYIAAPDWTEDDEEYWWAITLPAFSPNYHVRPAYIDLANMAKYMGERVIPARDPGSEEAVNHVPLDARD